MEILVEMWWKYGDMVEIWRCDGNMGKCENSWIMGNMFVVMQTTIKLVLI
jgi:hypothetical protein